MRCAQNVARRFGRGRKKNQATLYCSELGQRATINSRYPGSQTFGLWVLKFKKLKLITFKPVKEKENKYNLVKPTKFRKGEKENRKSG